ncbi:MAG: hypothetical protein J5821_01120 [Alphaproteobacteria bacterium]|nr:hypothetical protein [Alphaproteobacteria bacterium]
MKKFLVGLLFCSLAEAQVSEVEVVTNLKDEIVSESSKNAKELQKILERYFNDGCKVVVNNEEMVLKKDRFSQYASVGAAFLPNIKKDYEFEFPKKDLSDDGKSDVEDDGKRSELSAFLNISKKQRIKINFVLENEKLSEVVLKDVPLNRGQNLILRGIFNLLK